MGGLSRRRTKIQGLTEIRFALSLSCSRVAKSLTAPPAGRATRHDPNIPPKATRDRNVIERMFFRIKTFCRNAP